jgi:hypothetical protein
VVAFFSGGVLVLLLFFLGSGGGCGHGGVIGGVPVGLVLLLSFGGSRLNPCRPLLLAGSITSGVDFSVGVRIGNMVARFRWLVVGVVVWCCCVAVV